MNEGVACHVLVMITIETHCEEAEIWQDIPLIHTNKGENYTLTIIYIFYLIECKLNFISRTCCMCITLCQIGHCMSYIQSQMLSSDKIWECDGMWFHKSLILFISLRTTKANASSYRT